MEKATELGAAKTLNYKENDFGEQWAAEKIDVILDCVGGDYWKKNMKVKFIVKCLILKLR